MSLESERSLLFPSYEKGESRNELTLSADDDGDVVVVVVVVVEDAEDARTTSTSECSE